MQAVRAAEHHCAVECAWRCNSGVDVHYPSEGRPPVCALHSNFVQAGRWTADS